MSFSRRTFLAASAALPVFQALQAAPSMQKPASLKLGVASYSLRKLSRAQAIEAMKAFHLQHINIKDVHLSMKDTPEQIAAGRKEFDDAGLIVTGGGTINLQGNDEQLKAAFEYAKAARLPIMVSAPTAETLPKVEKLVKEYNIKVAIHNHGPEDKHFPSPQSALKLIKNMDPRMGLCIDVGHTTRTGTGAIESIREAGPRLLDMHIKDLTDLMNKDSQCDVGDGAMPIVGIFRELKKMNYQGGIMLEYEINADNPLPGMHRSISYMRGVLAALDETSKAS